MKFICRLSNCHVLKEYSICVLYVHLFSDVFGCLWFNLSILRWRCTMLAVCTALLPEPICRSLSVYSAESQQRTVIRHRIQFSLHSRSSVKPQNMIQIQYKSGFEVLERFLDVQVCLCEQHEHYELNKHLLDVPQQHCRRQKYANATAWVNSTEICTRLKCWFHCGQWYETSDAVVLN
jgi:hypothetical protein